MHKDKHGKSEHSDLILLLRPITNPAQKPENGEALHDFIGPYTSDEIIDIINDVANYYNNQKNAPHLPVESIFKTLVIVNPHMVRQSRRKSRRTAGDSGVNRFIITLPDLQLYLKLRGCKG